MRLEWRALVVISELSRYGLFLRLVGLDFIGVAFALGLHAESARLNLKREGTHLGVGKGEVSWQSTGCLLGGCAL